MKKTGLKMSLKSGIACTDENSFPKSLEICRIIESCAAHRVSKLKFGALELCFDPPPQVVSISGDDAISQIKLKEMASEEEKALAAEELKTRQDQIAELFVSDPLAAEQMLRDGDLVESDERAD